MAYCFLFFLFFYFIFYMHSDCWHTVFRSLHSREVLDFRSSNSAPLLATEHVLVLLEISLSLHQQLHIYCF